MTSFTRTLIFATLAVLFGCVSVPKQPTTLALPGTGKSLDQFNADDLGCRQLAGSQATTERSTKCVVVTPQQANPMYARYDYAYLQSMYAKGHRIPVYLPLPPEPQPSPAAC